SDAHDVAGRRLGLPLRSANQRHRCPHQSPAPESRRPLRAPPYTHCPGNGLYACTGKPGKRVMMRSLYSGVLSVWNSVAFRLTLNYSLFALCTSLVLLVSVYYQTTQI